MFFQLGSVVVPLEAVLDFRQEYELVGGVVRLTMMSGGQVQQVNWRRLRTIISGGGWWTLGLDHFNFDGPVVLKCGGQRSISSPSNMIVLPAYRRTDAGYTPIGHALDAQGQLVPTPLALVADTATLAVVAGAIGYQATYWPQITVFADPPRTEIDASNAQHRYTLTAETTEPIAQV